MFEFFWIFEFELNESEELDVSKVVLMLKFNDYSVYNSWSQYHKSWRLIYLYMARIVYLQNIRYVDFGIYLSLSLTNCTILLKDLQNKYNQILLTISQLIITQDLNQLILYERILILMSNYQTNMVRNKEKVIGDTECNYEPPCIISI